jgi:hypothetical protein
MNKEKEKILKVLFAPGDLRDAAICIDHYVMTAMHAIHDEELAGVIVAAGVSIIGILSALESKNSVDEVIADINKASRLALEEAMTEFVARAFTQSGGAVL